MKRKLFLFVTAMYCLATSVWGVTEKTETIAMEVQCSFSFMFDDDGVTGVTSAFDRKKNGQIYNLQGLPAVESQHGIVIRNGSKYYNE